MRKSLLDEILRKCRREMPRHPQFDNFMHWTFVIKDNRIVSDGVNRHHEPDKFYGYHSNGPKSDDGFRPKWHSELDAIKRCRQNLVDCVAVNVRMNKSGQLRLSMPCRACRNILHVVNVRKVYFTTEFGWGGFDL